ncbi:MAG: hypothetical protein ABSG55_04930 [Dehalococcoidia bacterium]|jgi:hypothetical protein
MTNLKQGDEATIGIMFDEACQGQSIVCQWADAIDAKALAVFGAASVLIGAIPAIGGVRAHGWEWVPWVIAGIAWAVTSLLCWLAYSTREYRLGPDPSVVLEDSWRMLAPYWYRYYRIRDMGRAWTCNQSVLNAKAKVLRWALPFLAIESAALLTALMLQR